MFPTSKIAIRNRLVELFTNFIRRSRNVDERLSALKWLSQSRDVVASDLSVPDKLRRLSGLIDSRAAIVLVTKRIVEALHDYRRSDLPMAMKIAIPATVAALPFVGGHAAGIAAFGGAVGVPVLLLVFLGTAGITAIIEAVIRSPELRPQIADVIDIILENERLRQASARMKTAMRQQPTAAARFSMPTGSDAIRDTLMRMDPFDFERHVMSFFEAAGLVTWVTQRSNDFGMDGVAVHANGWIITQCKRNAPDNKVGRPIVQQFKGVIEEQNAFHGFVVTTSSFTEEAQHSAQLSRRLSLIDIDRLVDWHLQAPQFDFGSGTDQPQPEAS